jgi:hypothetical protein
LLLLDGEEKLEFRRQFLLGVEAVGEVNPANSAVGMDGDSQCFDVVATIGSSGEIRQVELNLIPPLVQPHRHGTDERLHAGGRLVVGSSEPSAHIFVVEHLNFEGEVFFELSDSWSTFLMIMTRKGSLIPSVSFSFWGQVMKAVVTLVPMISRTED